ncbi:hypothetical protein [Diplocloster agilis]|uniref:hypothetical protein n=1 Tax=Diplocloster agilis TaxID=2850323 RepID=UPI00130E3D4F|nr:hypothetical protein [Suonthocola fibrivorans]MCU6732338.1 hypothetical protein [Suonthocola fibrivorans]
MQNMTQVWPGYWGTPLKNPDIEMDKMSGLSKTYSELLLHMTEAVNAGNFGYFTATYFPAATSEYFTDIDSVWEGVSSSAEFLETVQKTFLDDMEKNLVPPIPKPSEK